MTGNEDDFHKDPVEGLPLDLHKTVGKFSYFQVSKSYFVVVLLLQLQLAVHRAGGVEDLEEGAGGEHVHKKEVSTSAKLVHLKMPKRVAQMQLLKMQPM